MKINNFGIPFYLDEKNYEITFDNNIQAEMIKSKKLNEMEHLYDDGSLIEKSDLDAYTFYSNIFTKDYREVFERFNYTNGITILKPNSLTDECEKNSGHYHMTKENQTNPNMECYEVLHGTAVFILQKAKNLDDDILSLEQCIIVIANENEKIIVPPHYGHCVVNVGDGPLIFGNLAAPCPLNYDVINDNSGFFTYVHKIEELVVLTPNLNYKYDRKIKIVKPLEAKHLGIDFNKSLNESFILDPKKFDYLDNPDQYIEEVEKLIGVSR